MIRQLCVAALPVRIENNALYTIDRVTPVHKLVLVSQRARHGPVECVNIGSVIHVNLSVVVRCGASEAHGLQEACVAEAGD